MARSSGSSHTGGGPGIMARVYILGAGINGTTLKYGAVQIIIAQNGYRTNFNVLNGHIFYVDVTGL